MNRYIEAEEVEKRIDIVLGSEPKAWDKKALKELKMYVVHAVPTADVRENVRGHWVADRYCSVCDFDKHEIDCCCGMPQNYCPNCGARMIRGEA